MIITNRNILKLICSLIAFTIISTAYAENVENPKNSIYLELGGNAGIYSVNYERFFARDWGARVGLGALWEHGYAAFGVPVLINKYWGNPNSHHKFETGAGAVYFKANKTNRIFKHHHGSHSDDILGGTASIGYRYLPKTSGMTYKIAFTPIMVDSYFIPWIGVSVGTTF